MSNLSQVVVVIPALNEQESLPLVLADLPSSCTVIVADNGSTDDTAVAARDAGAIVVCEPQRGYGAACLSALAHLDHLITNGRTAPLIVAFVDADYSDHPDELPLILEPIFSDRADLVIGSRLRGARERASMPAQSIYGNRLACFLIRILFGVRYSDLGPFRAIRYSSLKQLEMSDQNYGWTVEMQIKAARAQIRITEVPVKYRRRIGKSKISGTISGTIKAGSKILFLIAKYGLSHSRNSKNLIPQSSND